MIRRHPRSTRTDTLFPYTTLFRSYGGHRSLDRWRNRGGRAWRPCPLLCVALSGCFSKEKRTPPEILTERPAISLVATVRPTHNSSRPPCRVDLLPQGRSEEHTSELQSLMRISYAVFCLKKKNTKHSTKTNTTDTTRQIHLVKLSNNLHINNT